MLDAWRAGSGNELSEVITALRARFSDLPLIDDGPGESRATAERRAEAEATRCTILVNNSLAATERVKSLNTTIQRANTRIEELNSALAAGAEDIRSLASALASYTLLRVLQLPERSVWSEHASVRRMFCQ